MTNFSSEPTLGEIYRMCQATNAQMAVMSQQVTSAMLAIPVLQTQMTGAEDDIHELKGDVKEIAKRSAYISGGIAVLFGIAKAVFPWKPTP